MPMWNTRSIISRTSVIASTGVARIWMRAVAYMAHTNSGISNQPMPGARSLWTVAMKFSPVKIEEKPRMKTAAVIRVTAPEVVVLVRRIERPAGVDRADDHRGDRHDRADHPEIETRQVQPRETPRPWRPASAAARSCPATPGIEGMMNRNTMIAPCSVKKRLYISAVTVHAEQSCAAASAASGGPAARKCRRTGMRSACRPGT